MAEDGSGYYIVKCLDKNTDDGTVSYQSLEIPLTRFKADFAGLLEGGKIKEYISVEE
jgi:hypothetical protein